MKDEIGGVAIGEFVVITISYHEHKDVLLNNKCLRHLMNRIQNKTHQIETYQIIGIFLSCFDDKRYILNNGYDELPSRDTTSLGRPLKFP